MDAPLMPAPPNKFEVRDPNYERKVRDSFAKQAAMATMGITLERVTPGEAELLLPFRSDLTQQNGFLHAGVVTTAMDSACGYAAFTLMEAGASVLSVEFKVNLLAPARGGLFRAVARVVRAGRTLTVVSAEMFAHESSRDDPPTLVAIFTGTMMSVREPS
ncbi:MAG TPA: PaaI family thioesterase [Gemmatimonadaceae bacterium]|nr:PaaI family thioesterase [Gemmatimonadaceae bacterium]